MDNFRTIQFYANSFSLRWATEMLELSKSLSSKNRFWAYYYILIRCINMDLLERTLQRRNVNQTVAILPIVKRANLSKFIEVFKIPYFYSLKCESVLMCLSVVSKYWCV